MKQKSTLQKQNNGKTITDSRLAIWLRDRLYPLLIFLTGTKVRCRVEVVNACQPIPGKPVIFAANHSAFQDSPIMLRVTGRRSYIFSGKQNLAFIDWVFFVLNGTIWVDRKSKEDMAASKDAVLEYLAKGQSILWFPEGTWNLTPNQLMMPMKWGIIDMARQAGARFSRRHWIMTGRRISVGSNSVLPWPGMPWKTRPRLSVTSGTPWLPSVGI